MTCLEKFRQKYPDIPVERILKVYCPHVSGEMYDMHEPDYCPHENGCPECWECWDREVPGTGKANIEELRQKLGEFCKTQQCGTCPLRCGFDCDYDAEDGFIIPDDKVITAFEAAFRGSPEATVEPDPQPTETVNHPKHYGREGAMECIDEMFLVFGKEATMNFCLLNAWKYRYRAGAKGGEEDLKKSDWYLAKFKELKGGD